MVCQRGNVMSHVYLEQLQRAAEKLRKDEARKASEAGKQRSYEKRKAARQKRLEEATSHDFTIEELKDLQDDSYDYVPVLLFQRVLASHLRSALTVIELDNMVNTWVQSDTRKGVLAAGQGDKLRRIQEILNEETTCISF